MLPALFPAVRAGLSPADGAPICLIVLIACFGPDATRLSAIIYGFQVKFTPLKGQNDAGPPIPAGRSPGRRQGRTADHGLCIVQRLKKTVVMVGMMGAGKTAVGTAVARHLGVPFVDSDEEIVRAAHRSIAEIFERDGEPFFRARETEVLGRLLRGSPCILSTGGGAFLSETNRGLIREAGVSVWLRADLDLLWQRVRHKTTRPLLRTANPRETLRALYEARVPVYALADIAVDAAPDLSIEDMAGKVVAALAARQDVLEGV
jgi:shikimate kinase